MTSATVAAFALGCGENAAPDADEPQVGEASAGLAACATVAAGGGWLNQGFAAQAQRFHVELDATPSATNLDNVIGLSGGAAGGFTDLAAIVRFNDAGRIDARNGDAYAATTALGYVAGATYHVRFDVDLRGHRYSAWVRTPGASYTQIARDYAFRTEQAGVLQLDHVASEVDAAAGSSALCNTVAVADATTADGCTIADAGAGFVTFPVQDASVLMNATFSLTASAGNIDGVIGLAGVPVSSFSHLAAAMRYAPSSVFEARDGDTYRVDATVLSGTGRHDFRVIADVTTHRYSVMEGFELSFQRSIEFARQFAFRPTQASVTHLDRIVAIVDGPEGWMKICRPVGAASSGIAYSREGTFSVQPLGDAVLISDGTATRKLDASGQVVLESPRAGKIGLDGLGGIFIGSVAGNTLTLYSFDANLTQRWSTVATVPDASTIQSIAGDGTGTVRVGLATTAGGVPEVDVIAFRSDGMATAQSLFPGRRVTFDGAQTVIARDDAGAVEITRYAANFSVVASSRFPGRANVTALEVAPDHSVVFGGDFLEPIDFGGGTLVFEEHDTGPNNGYVVKLTPAGAHAFSRRTDFTLVTGLAVNANRVAVSGTLDMQFITHRLSVYDASGATIPLSYRLPINENGRGLGVALSDTGRIWWNFVADWPFVSQVPTPFLVAITQ